MTRHHKISKLEEMSICGKHITGHKSVSGHHIQFTIWHFLCQNIQTEDIFVLDSLILFVILALEGPQRFQGYLWSQCHSSKSKVLCDRGKALKIKPKVNSEPIKRHHSDIQTKHRTSCDLSRATWQAQVATVHLFWEGLQNTKLQLHITRICLLWLTHNCRWAFQSTSTFVCFL